MKTFGPRPPRRAAAVLTAVAAVAGGMTVLAHPQASGAATPTRFRLTAAGPTTSALDIPCPQCVQHSRPAGAHIGGTEIDAGRLLDASGHVVGHYALDAVGVTPFGPSGPGELQLTATLVIGGSQLVAQGLEEPPLTGGTAAIVGGTGRYSAARGELGYTDEVDGTTDLRITLTPSKPE